MGLIHAPYDEDIRKLNNGRSATMLVHHADCFMNGVNADIIEAFDENHVLIAYIVKYEDKNYTIQKNIDLKL